MIDIRTTAEVTMVSIPAKDLETFKLLVNRALNTWIDAPTSMKDLGDLLTHGMVMQGNVQSNKCKHGKLEPRPYDLTYHCNVCGKSWCDPAHG